MGSATRQECLAVWDIEYPREITVPKGPSACLANIERNPPFRQVFDLRACGNATADPPKPH